MIRRAGEAFSISSKKHGESKIILLLFSRDSGLLRAIFRSSSLRGIHACDKVKISLRSRLSTGILSGEIDLLESNFIFIRKNAFHLRILNVMCSLMSKLTGMESFDSFFMKTDSLIRSLKGSPELLHLVREYVIWELNFLSHMGFGLQLNSCAVHKKNLQYCGDLRYVSPRTGHAVCAKGATGYEKMLLPFPSFLKGGADMTLESALESMDLSKFFLEKRVELGSFLSEMRSRIMLPS